MNVLLGVSASISAYKVCELVRLYVKNNHYVKVILTKDAEKFVSKTTLETLSKNKVYTDPFDQSQGVIHIELAKWADIFIIAPASANAISNLARGSASSLLYSTALAYDKKCLIFPSMNTKMYTNIAVERNITLLKEFGYKAYGTETGELACGTSGTGRLTDVKNIYDISELEFKNTKYDLRGKNILITVGATKSYIDSVRYITNSSSGKMGIAILKEAFIRGASITLACNSDLIEKHSEIKYFINKLIIIDTSCEVYEKIISDFKKSDIYISSAAFCDYKSKPSFRKIKRGDLSLELEASDDVFISLSKVKSNQFMVGFALEDTMDEESFLYKLKKKNMDLLVGNSLNSLNVDSSDFTLFDKNEKKYEFKNYNKKDLAREIFNIITS